MKSMSLDHPKTIQPETDIIPVDINTNVFMFINNYFTYYHVSSVSGPPPQSDISPTSDHL